MIVLDNGQAGAVGDLALALRRALAADGGDLDLEDAVIWLRRAATTTSAAALDSLRRSDEPVCAAPPPPALTVDESAWEIWFEGRALSLTLLQYKLLGVLVGSWGHTVPLPRLAQAMFETPFADAARITAHVKRLRRRLTEQGVRGCRIEAVRGIGFRVVGHSLEMGASCPQLPEQV